MSWTPERIRQLKIQADLSNDELARTMGISKYTLFDWIRGKRHPSPSNCRKLEEFERDGRGDFFSVILTGEDLILAIRALLDGRYLAIIAGLPQENFDKALSLIMEQATKGNENAVR